MEPTDQLDARNRRLPECRVRDRHCGGLLYRTNQPTRHRPIESSKPPRKHDCFKKVEKILQTSPSRERPAGLTGRETLVPARIGHQQRQTKERRARRVSPYHKPTSVRGFSAPVPRAGTGTTARRERCGRGQGHHRQQTGPDRNPSHRLHHADGVGEIRERLEFRAPQQRLTLRNRATRPLRLEFLHVAGRECHVGADAFRAAGHNLSVKTSSGARNNAPSSTRSRASVG